MVESNIFPPLKEINSKVTCAVFNSFVQEVLSDNGGKFGIFQSVSVNDLIDRGLELDGTNSITKSYPQEFDRREDPIEFTLMGSEENWLLPRAWKSFDEQQTGIERSRQELVYSLQVNVDVTMGTMNQVLHFLDRYYKEHGVMLVKGTMVVRTETKLGSHSHASILGFAPGQFVVSELSDENLPVSAFCFFVPYVRKT